MQVHIHCGLLPRAGSHTRAKQAQRRAQQAEEAAARDAEATQAAAERMARLRDQDQQHWAAVQVSDMFAGPSLALPWLHAPGWYLLDLHA
jgi:hypothetical protein